MHELSIAQAMIEEACEAASREGASRIDRLVVRVGRLAGVVPEALLFSFEVAAQGTACEGAILNIDFVDVTVMCPQCQQSRALALDHFHLICPECGMATPNILSGRELQLVSLEIDSPEVALHAPAHH